jgi:hypothetical protein
MTGQHTAPSNLRRLAAENIEKLRAGDTVPDIPLVRQASPRRTQKGAG